MPAKTLPKTIVYKGTKFNLLDVQYSKSNAEFAAQIYSHRLPKAKYVIRDETIGGNQIWGLYTTYKVSNTIEKKKGK
jgi:hypothetical protein